MQRNSLTLKSDNCETYKKPFILPKLTEVIHRSHSTTVGPDEIHYKFLKHLPKRVTGVPFNRPISVFFSCWTQVNY